MKRKTIADTPFGVALDLKTQGLEAAKFIVRHPSCVLGEDISNALKSSVKMTVNSACADVYNKVVDSGKVSKLFTLVDLSDVEDSIPTIFTLDDITLDGRYISENIPRAYQNAWLNLTSIRSKSSVRDAYNSNLQIRDTPRLAALFTRGILCMSYNDSDSWLTSTQAEFVLSAFSYIFSFQFSTMFNLDEESVKLLRSLLSAYFAQKLQSSRDPLEVPPLLFRCPWLGTPREITDRFSTFGEVRQKLAKEMGLQDVNELNLDLVCKIFSMFGPERTSKLSESNFVRFMSRSSMERNATIMSIYYPPYFVYMLMSLVSGVKNPIFMNMIKFSNMKLKLYKFVDSLTQSDFLIRSIDR